MKILVTGARGMLGSDVMLAADNARLWRWLGARGARKRARLRHRDVRPLERRLPGDNFFSLGKRKYRTGRSCEE